MKQLKQWIRDHPFLSIGFTFLFTLLAAVLGASNLTWPYAAFVVLVLVFLVLYCREAWLYLLVLLLSCSMATAPIQAAPPPERKAAGAVIAVTVICIGGYCVYKLVKFCQKHFPKESPTTNSPPEIVSQEMGASFASVGDPCDEEDMPATTFVLSITPVEPPTMTASAGHETQNLDGYRKELARHGLDLDVPYSATKDSTITFTNGIVGASAGGATVTIERSGDLKTWEPLLTVRSDKPFAVVDTTAQAQTFYRVR